MGEWVGDFSASVSVCVCVCVVKRWVHSEWIAQIGAR